MSADTSAHSSTTPLAAPICPLCGGPNACAPACSGSFDTPCWCRTAVFTPELLARVPAPLQGQACVCARCAAAAARAPENPSP